MKSRTPGTVFAETPRGGTKGATDLGAREPIMEDSDGEEYFTFGSFTLEDTMEFKKSYSNSLDRKKNVVEVAATCAAPACSKTTTKAATYDPSPRPPQEALPTVPAVEGSPMVAPGWETGRAKPSVTRDTTGEEEEALEKVCNGVGTSGESAEQETLQETKPVVSRPLNNDPSTCKTPNKAAAPKNLPRSEPMSWARIAAGPAKPFVRPASAATGLPRSTHESSRVSQAASEGVVAISRAQVEENADDECRSEVDQTPNGRGSRSVDIIDVVDVVDAENGVGSSGKGLVGEGKVEVALARANGHASNVTAERKAGETEVVVPRARYSNGSASPGTEKGDGGGEKKQKPRQGVGEDYEKIRVADRSAKNKGANEGANNGVEVCAEEAGLDSTAAETEKESEEVKGQRAWLALLGMLGSEDGAAPVGKDATVLHGGDLGPSLGDLLHRGLVNTGNSCFRSAVLQALLACEPFVKVLFRAASGLRDSVPAQEALPTWAQLARFAAAFEPPKPGASAPLSSGPSRKGGARSGAGADKGGWSTAVGRNRGGRNLRAGVGVEPVVLDETMSKAFGMFRNFNNGEQEDAQEFLAFFLDQLHEEIIQAKKLHNGTGDGGNGQASESSIAGEEDDWRQEQESEWLEIGKGGTKAVMNTPNHRQNDSNSSVVTGMFYGMFRSEVTKSGAKASVTLEPFHCLQLDLDPPSSSTHPGSSHKSSEISAWEVAPAPANGLETTTSGASGRGGGAWGIAGGRGQKIGGVQGANGSWGNGGAGLGTPASGAKTTVLEEALAALFRGEAVTGVKGRQNMEVKASRTLTLERAPKVLTLHLKQFAFHPELGPRKLARRVRYPPELTIPPKIMAPSLAHEVSKRGPLKYRLFTVVLHHGRSLHGGHYTALVRDPRGKWRHCDDQLVSPETEGHALNPVSGHPYLLLYTLV